MALELVILSNFYQLDSFFWSEFGTNRRLKIIRYAMMMNRQKKKELMQYRLGDATDLEDDVPSTGSDKGIFQNHCTVGIVLLTNMNYR